MTKPIRAQPPLRFIPPNYSSIVRWATSLLLPYLRWRYGIAGVQVEGIDRLVDLYADFAAHKTRFMLAFRHSHPNDPLCMATLVWNRLPRAARSQQVQIPQPHSHFMYDRGIPLWAGKLVGWTYAHLGGTPIRRGKADLAGLKSVRQLFANSRFPIGAAPEGATNGHNSIVGLIEPGIAQFGFWCVEDLRKSDRSQEVLIVPIGIQYSYKTPPWKAIDRLLRELEADCGLEAKATISLGDRLTPEQEARLYQRLLRLGGQLLTQLEQFYSKFYHQSLPTPNATAPLETNLDTANAQIADRLHALMNAALTVSETAFNLPSKGSFTDRCRRLEQAAWDRIYREDLPDLETLCAVDRALADRVAQEAEQSLWHMRIVETLVSVTGHYVREKFTADRFAETLLLLWDVACRIQGQFPFPRPKLARQSAIVTVGEPLSISDRTSAYKSNRRQAVTDLTADLQVALEKLIR